MQAPRSGKTRVTARHQPQDGGFKVSSIVSARRTHARFRAQWESAEQNKTEQNRTETETEAEADADAEAEADADAEAEEAEAEAEAEAEQLDVN